MKSALPDRCMQRILESSLGLSQLAFTVWRSFWRTFYDPRGIRVEGPSRPEKRIHSPVEDARKAP